ncbi:MAG: hypothetical protein MPJ50_16085 [Pirellulales bacterium]|nr:hypothetical protein [Pirellulales bacterium]
MNTGNQQSEPSKRMFHVQVGHHQMTVEAESRAEALSIARRKLGADLPRLWDMIYDMQDTDFDIRQTE